MKISSLLLILPQLVQAKHDKEKCLYQTDFDKGTKIITKPGTYKLCEDITFFPNVNTPSTSSEGAANAFEPDFSDETYEKNKFGLGFFAALAIAADDVTIKLDGHSIKQSQEHALLQRFFAVIELADSPFITDKGPAEFVGESTFNPASNVKILGPGTIGLSSHHGIHGNMNNNVLIKDVKFVDFEVAAVSLNKVEDLKIESCDIVRNRHDVPVLGMFSAAKFIRPYGKVLKDLGFSMSLRGVETTAAEVYDKLVASINNVFDDVMQFGQIREETHKEEYDLFHNSRRVVDGPCYAFVVHGKGPAVGDFKFSRRGTERTSKRITIKDNNINRITCWTYEIPAIIGGSEKVATDPRGAVFQLIRSSDGSSLAINEDGTYKGNVVADMQIMVSKAIQDGIITSTPELQTKPNSIDTSLIYWAESATQIYKPKYRCNGDSMHHVGKGMTIIRVDETEGFTIKDNKIENIFNLSPPLFQNCLGGYHDGSNEENKRTQQGTNIRGISVAAVTGYDKKEKKGKDSIIKGNTIKKMDSPNAVIVAGIDVQGESDSVKIEDNIVDLKANLARGNNAFVGLRIRSSVDSEDISVSDTNDFDEGVEIIEKSIEDTESSSTSASKGCPHADNDWVYGGTPGSDHGGSCPFANAMSNEEL